MLKYIKVYKLISIFMADFKESNLNYSPNVNQKEVTPIIELLQTAELLGKLRKEVWWFSIKWLTASENTPNKIVINWVQLEWIDIKNNIQFHNIIQYIMTLIKIYKDNWLNPKENKFYLGTWLLWKIMPTNLKRNDLMIEKSWIDVTYWSEEWIRKVFWIKPNESSKNYVEKIVIFLNKLLENVNFDYEKKVKWTLQT